ncbi:MAG: NUDIX hydrolase [Bacteroidota bacterium]|nr:NUDIX hydrolase [Bacteroidota bacterium]
MNLLFLEYAKKIQSIAQIGLAFSQNQFDIERYGQLRQISFEMMEALSTSPIERIITLFEHEQGYQTPKVDIRGVVFRGDKILMVREKADGCWSLPGGWADIGFSPNEIAVKEVWEEAGLNVEPVRILAVLDKKCHNHPPSPWHVYKIFILCRDNGGTPKPGDETLDAGFFTSEKLPPLSVERITDSQIELMFEYLTNPEKLTVCD